MIPLKRLLSVVLWPGIGTFTLAAEADFEKDIRPVLEAKCVACHQAGIAKGKFDLTTRAELLRGGEDGVVLTAGKPEESAVYQKVLPGKGGKPEMPKKGTPLTSAETTLLREWIAAGAPWPEGVILKEKAKADKNFWAFQALGQGAPPAAEDAPEAWRHHPIDCFVWARLREQKLAPNPPASPRDFIRRATYDLTGLPPTPEEAEAFAEASARNGQAAVEALIDRLLASPRYGEQWGRHWLDVVRFGESRGFERNEIINQLWPFRDYVIRSFNEDKPFDQFTREHLAGDVIAPGQPEAEVGAAFLVAGPYDDVGNQDAVAAAQIRADTVDEMIRATSETFLGLSVGCARCHDHKFDPLTQQDYHSLYAAFAGVRHGERIVATPQQMQKREAKVKPLETEKNRLAQEWEALKKVPAPTPEDLARREKAEKALAQATAELAAIPPLPVWWVGTRQPAPGPFHVFGGGNPQRPGAEVKLASLSVFEELASRYQVEPQAPESERRVALAQWLTAPDNPLTPRVLANRLWHYHFGRGIVETPSDFGYMGGRPSHPELLDWLAGQLPANGWKMKALHRLIMTSQTYRQAADWRAEAAAQDGDSRLLWRFPPRRLSAEEVRDTLLTTAGKLDLRMGGPGFRLYEYQQDNVATYVPLDAPGPETYRRAVYHQNARAARVDLMTDFDCPDPLLLSLVVPRPPRPSRP